MDKAKETTLEEDFERMEELLRQMESEEIGIEEAFSKYEEGIKLVKACNEKIDRVEKKVKTLSDDLKTEDFEA